MYVNVIIYYPPFANPVELITSMTISNIYRNVGCNNNLVVNIGFVIISSNNVLVNDVVPSHVGISVFKSSLSFFVSEFNSWVCFNSARVGEFLVDGVGDLLSFFDSAMVGF